MSTATGGPYAAAILAAGAGARLGFPKALLRLADGSSVLEGMAQALLEAGVGERVCVLPSGLDMALPKDLRALYNPAPERGMLSSIHVALADPSVAGAAGLLIWPIDCPRVPASVLRRLLGAAALGAELAVPSARGRRGHPAYFGHALFDALRRAPAEEGARAVLRAHRGALVHVACEDHAEAVLEDLDDLEALRRADLRGPMR